MKRILVGLVGILATAVVLGATTIPPQLISPTGSVAGQAIVSNGPSSVPTWQAVSAGSLAPIAANTVLGNFTGSSTVPAAFVVPSCSTANSALKYTSGTGLSCGTTFALTTGNLSQFAATTSAQLLGVLSDETGTGVSVFNDSPALIGTPIAPTAATNTNTTQLATTAFVEGEFSNPPATGFGSGTARPVAATTISATGAITPSQTAGIVGTTTNNSANAGSVGEYVTASAAAVANTSGVTLNVTSISLTAGDWDVSGWVGFNPTGTSAVNQIIAGISIVSATLSPVGSKQAIRASLTINVPQELETGTVRLSLSGTTTVYLVANESFTGGTSTVDGVIRARRVR